MPSVSERFAEPSLSTDRQEPNLPSKSRTSSRLLRSRREAPQPPQEPQLEERVVEAPRLSLSAEDRLVASDYSAVEPGDRAREGLRRQAMTGIVLALALFGAFSLGRLLLELFMPGGHLG